MFQEGIIFFVSSERKELIAFRVCHVWVVLQVILFIQDLLHKEHFYLSLIRLLPLCLRLEEGLSLTPRLAWRLDLCVSEELFTTDHSSSESCLELRLRLPVLSLTFWVSDNVLSSSISPSRFCRLLPERRDLRVDGRSTGDLVWATESVSWLCSPSVDCSLYTTQANSLLYERTVCTIVSKSTYRLFSSCWKKRIFLLSFKTSGKQTKLYKQLWKIKTAFGNK